MGLFSKLNNFFLLTLIILIPLYPKFPLVGVTGTFVSVRLEDFVIAIVVGFWFARTLLTRRLTHTPMHRTIWLYWAIGAVATFCGLTLFKLISPSLGVLHLLRRVEYMVLFFVGFDLYQRRDQLKGLIQVLLLVSFLVGLYGLGQQWFNLPVISTTNSEFSKGLALTLGAGARINSTFAGHYDLAAFCLFPLLLIIGLLSLKLKYKPLLLLIGTPIYLSMILSASRVTFAAFFITAFLFVIVIRKKLWLVPLMGLFLVSFLLSPQLIGRYRELIINHFSLVTSVSAQAPSPVDQTVPDALKPSNTPEDRSFNIRLQASWPRALRSFQKNPLTGTGYSSIGLASDNDYLRALAETGILGLAALALIVLVYFRAAAPLLLRPPKTLPAIFCLSVSFALLGLLINALFIDIFEASKIAVITWLLLGVSYKQLHRQPSV